MDIERDVFINKYNLDVKMIEEFQIDWGKLDEIYYDFIDRREQLDVYSNLLAELLRKQPKVHTVRSRIKDPEHLIAKLIRKTPERKKSKGEDFEFTIENYRTEITDLIGVRVIHIFKEDWKDIHEFINTTWSVKELQVNIREGDSRDIYEEQKILINYRETGYRSVHYLIEFAPTNELLTAEIQVRTIFEEGYGEIDHLLSYPNNNIPEVLTLNLLMLNRLAGSADEMSSAVKIIKEEWSEMQSSLIAKDDELRKLESRIEKLNIEKQEKESLVKDIGKIRLESNWYSDWSKELSSIINTNELLSNGDWSKKISSIETKGIFKLSGDSDTSAINKGLKKTEQLEGEQIKDKFKIQEVQSEPKVDEE
ncbi:RelA/SpoT domain-containing protein [Peribacillus butanolivorans]|uniref:RelA/SpoT domain-containing protein n=1 Tax=Peribacillus butanolivorans TaxID=421767 RepID=UPI00366CC981